MDKDLSAWTCNQCGNVGMSDGGDGYYYCTTCWSQADDVMDTGVCDEDLHDAGDQTGALYSAKHKRRITEAEPISQYNPQSQQFWSQMAEGHNEPQNKVKQEMFYDDVGPLDPSDFGSVGLNQYSHEDYYKELRNRYVMGVQMMLQAQCEALVEKFKVNPLICGIVGPIWLRYVVSTGILDDGWADEAILESESLPDEAENVKPRTKHRAEPHNIHGQRALIIWYKSLRKKIPLSCSLAVSFLGCHVLREAILPTDIVKWSIEGKLTYFDAFVEIERRIGRNLLPFPITLDQMFRPSQAVSAQKLESQAAQIAVAIGFHLPPVNFYVIASRYLTELSLHVEKILSTACRIYEWVMPPDLWLSANELKLPTRTCVMSILIVAIRILYNINGFGVWEKSLGMQKISTTNSDNAGKVGPANSPNMEDLETGSCSLPHLDNDMDTDSVKTTAHAPQPDLDTAEILLKLELRYDEINDTYDYSRDLPAYLQFCKDVIFAGLEPPLQFYQEEKGLIDQFWEFYQNEKDSEPCDGKQHMIYRQEEEQDDGLSDENLSNDKEYHLDSPSAENIASDKDNHLNSPSEDTRTLNTPQKTVDGDISSQQCSQEPGNSVPGSNLSVESQKEQERGIRSLKKNMEENRFCYIPPRVKTKRFDYLQYARKKDEGAMTYVAHADYYILLRACAKVAQVDIRIMHCAVLGFERRLAWTEEKIRRSLNVRTKEISCQFCSDFSEKNLDDDPNSMPTDSQI